MRRQTHRTENPDSGTRLAGRPEMTDSAPEPPPANSALGADSAPSPAVRIGRRLFENRNLGMLWFGQTVSIAGDSVYEKALLWLMLELTGSSALTGLVAMGAYLPALVVGLWAGVLVDRLDRRFVMVVADAARAALVLTIPGLFAIGLLNPWTLFGITFLVAGCAAFFNPARDSIIPAIVTDRTRLLKANAVIQSSWMFALVLGPALGLFFLNSLGVRTVDLFTIDGVTFLVSMVAILAIALPGESARDRGSRPPFLTDLFEGLRMARDDVRVRWLLIITAMNNFFIMGPATVGMAVFVREVLGRGIGSFMLIEVSYAVGMVAGTLLLPFWRRRLNNGRILLVGMVLDGITFIPLLWVDTLIGTCATIVVHSLAIPLLVVARPSLVQEHVSHRLQGRIFSMIGITVVGFTALSTGATGLVAEIVPMPHVYAVVGVGAAACGLWGWRVSSLRES